MAEQAGGTGTKDDPWQLNTPPGSDTMQIVGTALLGLTIQCARCHSHKFDPISQRDYYSLSSVFQPSLDPVQPGVHAALGAYGKDRHDVLCKFACGIHLHSTR